MYQHILDHTQILKFDLGNQRKVFKYFKWRRPPMEDDLKISKWNISASTYWTLLKF
jgi:hypothetical protein